jgi:YD repeat-containing protein
VTRFSYDVIDRRTAMTDAMSRVTWYGYDRLDRLVSVLNPAVSASTPISQQSFTSNGQWTTLTDANTNIVPFAHDGFDRLATTTYPLGSTKALTYDPDSSYLGTPSSAVMLYIPNSAADRRTQIHTDQELNLPGAPRRLQRSCGLFTV